MQLRDIFMNVIYPFAITATLLYNEPLQ